jgi:hypothetical protein
MLRSRANSIASLPSLGQADIHTPSLAERCTVFCRSRSATEIRIRGF